MTDKFANYCNTEERIKELSDYVHLNCKMIIVKMVSEMRRKLDIEPDRENKEGYVSLQLSIIGRMFNELVYALYAACHSHNMHFLDIVPRSTCAILMDLIQGKDTFDEGKLPDINKDLEKFNKYYLSQIDELRKNLEALP